jgi:hypothetical protein
MNIHTVAYISNFTRDEQNLHGLIGHNWISRQNDKLKVDLNFIAIRYY